MSRGSTSQEVHVVCRKRRRWGHVFLFFFNIAASSSRLTAEVKVPAALVRFVNVSRDSLLSGLWKMCSEICAVK